MTCKCGNREFLSCCESSTACLRLKTDNMASIVWDFYKVSEEDRSLVICNNWSKPVPRGGKSSTSFNTSNLISHLKHRKHMRMPGLIKMLATMLAAKKLPGLTHIGVFASVQGAFIFL